MKYYTSTTEFNCGIDLHAHQMYVCLMDRDGHKLVHTNIRNNDFAYFLKLVEPYRHDLTVCAECMFGWYWLSDACQAAGIPFVLAHALYLKAIHGGKNKNDRIDSEKIAHLLRTNLIPPAYVYPAAKRPLRALLRQRLYYVWRRADLLARIQSHQLAHNRPALRQTRPNQRSLGKTVAGSRRPSPAPVGPAKRSGHDPSLRHPNHRPLGLTLLYEIGDIARFPTVKDFVSYCRLVKGTVASAGRIKGLRGAKLGNPYLRWAFGEAAIIAKRDHAVLGPLAQCLEARMNGNKFKANTVLAIKLARSVYFMLRRHTVFDPDRLVAALARH
ncbi:MAG: transposase [Verrucomicrobiota bacterium]